MVSHQEAKHAKARLDVGKLLVILKQSRHEDLDKELGSPVGHSHWIF